MNNQDSISTHESPPDSEITLASGEVSRRRVLGKLVTVINLVIGAAVFGPVLGFVTSPMRRGQAPDNWIEVVPETELPAGQMRSVTYELRVIDGYTTAKRRYSVFLMRQSNDQVVAFDPTCPHLGCRVEFKSSKQRFICPCHGGVFDADGKLLSGPPPRGLTELTARVADGKIWIRRLSSDEA